jgi:hypothetical protein
VAVVLTNPLMVALMRAIFNPRAGDFTTAIPDPIDLCKFSSSAAIERYLLDNFIAASYRTLGGRSSKRSEQYAQRWLLFFATYLEYVAKSTDFQWWLLARAMPPRRFAIIAGLLAGVITAPVAATAAASSISFNGVRLGIIFAITLGCACGFMSGVMARVRFATQEQPSRGVRWRFVGGRLARRRVFGLSFGLSFGLVFGTSFGAAVGYAQFMTDSGDLYRTSTSLAAGITLGVMFALVVGIVGALAFSLEEVAGDLSSGASPTATLSRDRRTTLVSGGTFGVSVAIALFLALPMILNLGDFLSGAAPYGIVSSLRFEWRYLLSDIFRSTQPAGEVLHLQFAIGFAVTLAGLVAFSLAASSSAWPSWLISRLWFASRGLLPWRLMYFLKDAHRRGILRQNGSVYQFRHVELQRHLAENASAGGVTFDASSGRISVARPKPLQRRRLVLSTGVAILAVAATGVATVSAWRAGPLMPVPAASAAYQAGGPSIHTCAGRALRRPGSYMLACNSGNYLIVALKWTRWTDVVATGYGQVAGNNCIPDCADGTYVRSRVLIVLSHPLPARHSGRRYFSSMIISGPSIFSTRYTLGIYGPNGNCPPVKLCLD